MLGRSGATSSHPSLDGAATVEHPPLANSPSPQGPSHVPRFTAGERVGWIVLALILWLSRLRLPVDPAIPELDPSWQQALNYALAHGIRFGRELVFTFGPMGGPAHARYEPTLVWQQLFLFEFLFKAVLAWRWTCLVRREPSVALRALYLCVLLAFVEPDDAFYTASMVALAALQLREERVGRTEQVLDLLLLATIALIKFTYFTLGAGLVALLCVRAAWRSRRELAWTASIAFGALLGVWMACGQRPWDLPLYVLRSAELARGYTESQATDGPWIDVQLGLGTLALLGLLLALHVWSAPVRRTALLTALAVAGGAGIAFRESYTNHVGRAIVFFGCVMLLPAALSLRPGARALRRWSHGTLRIGGVLLAVVGYTRVFEGEFGWPTFGQGAHDVEAAMRGLARLPTKLEHAERMRVGLERKYDLPHVRAIVGREPIDLVGVDLAWIFLNHLNWRPRPVLQSYSTSTAGLVELDGDFFAGPDAPPFVLYQDSMIGERWSGIDDSAARLRLMRDYVPVALEKGLVLLRRDPVRAAHASDEREIVGEFDLHPGETLSLPKLPGEVLIARFDVRYSWVGWLRRLLLHAPITKVTLGRNDGQVLERRFLPDMARAGVLVRPALEFTFDWIDLHAGRLKKRYTGLRLTSESNWSTNYAPTYHVTIERCDGLLGAIDPECRDRLVLGCLGRTPDRTALPGPPAYEFLGDGDRVLFGPEGTLEFDLRPADHHVHLVCGQYESSLRQGDGIDLIVELRTQDGATRELERRSLDREHPDSRRLTLEIELPPADARTLVIRTQNLPGHDTAWDLPFLNELRIDG